jgi:hypothetical protein
MINFEDFILTNYTFPIIPSNFLFSFRILFLNFVFENYIINVEFAQVLQYYSQGEDGW